MSPPALAAPGPMLIRYLIFRQSGKWPQFQRLVRLAIQLGLARVALSGGRWRGGGSRGGAEGRGGPLPVP
jgi:hypothetical protein